MKLKTLIELKFEYHDKGTLRSLTVDKGLEYECTKDGSYYYFETEDGERNAIHEKYLSKVFEIKEE